MSCLTDCLFIRQSDEHVPGEPFGFYSPEWSDLGRTVIHRLYAICYYCTASEQQPAVCMPHLANDSLSITIVVLWDHFLVLYWKGSICTWQKNTQSLFNYISYYITDDAVQCWCIRFSTLTMSTVDSNEWMMCLFVLHDSQVADLHDRSDPWFDRHLINKMS